MAANATPHKGAPRPLESLPPPEEVIANRSGDVLIKHTTLKADHFPSCHNTKLTPILEGAPNFRQIEGLPVYGVAIPTVTGLRSALNAVGASKGARKVYWQNLREEPLVFINGNPFVVREADQPFCNLEYTGIDRSRVEDMERRLKEDILLEASAFGNRILVKHENEDLSLYDHWEPVTAADVQTPNEVYAELRADGYDIDYVRIPVTDEKAPKDSDFDVLIRVLWPHLGNAAFIFNCQMGRGRTTTGTIIASLLYLRKLGAFPPSASANTQLPPGAEVPPWFTAALDGAQPVGEQTRDKLRWGMYDVVRSLLRVLENGTEAKAVLDAVIDTASQMQNLREAIGSYRSRFLKEMRERQRASLLSVCLEYLERYYMLLSFASYLYSPQFNPDSPRQSSFADWMASRPELRSVLMRLLRRNSMAALDLHVPAMAPAALTAAGVPAPAIASNDVIAMRSGAVLGPFTILKEDLFPGMRSSKVAQVIEGAPNFRGMPGMPIFGTGMPTTEGIVQVLRVVSGSSSPNASKRVHALWINMREEPVVYIKGRPFVLREEVRPLKNMMEYSGIDAERLASMEERLKRDVLAEAARFGGRILLAYEGGDDASGAQLGELRDRWESIQGPDDVQTPADVYGGLAAEGFAVQYFRIPVTDGTPPTEQDFDTILRSILDWGLENPVIFNCQLGIGRTTAGMVIAGLTHLYSTGSLSAADTGGGRAGSSSLDQMDDAAFRGFLLEGMSPRSEAEEDEVEEHRELDDEREPRVWDLEPGEMEVQRSLAAGGYVGVRKVTRLLEEGEASKKVVDAIIDAASDLINLRVAIMKYRKPRSSYKYMRPEMQQRHAAFKRGSAYLERYCQLIAFASYLEHVGPETQSFGEWLRGRPDLAAAFNAMHENPGAALEPVPFTKLPVLLGKGDGGAGDAAADQRPVLARRKGRTLTKRTILKSYMQQQAQRHAEGGEPEGGVPDYLQAGTFPVYCVGNVSSSELGRLLSQLGAGPGCCRHVVVSDLREELVVYVNGTPYMRRELEMPAAAMHHAGIHASQLQELEGLLREDVLDEAALWGGRVLLHREVDLPVPLPARGSSPGSASAAAKASHQLAAANGDHAPPPAAASSSPEEPAQPAQAESNGHATPQQPASSSGAAAEPGAPTTGAADAAAGSAGAGNGPGAQQAAAGGHNNASTADDVTALVDLYPGTSVAPFWEVVDGDDPNSLQTPLEVMQVLDEAGFRISYRRIPLSRERTPEAEDVDALHFQASELAAAALAAGAEEVLHLVLSRTPTGSSARFVSALYGAYLSRAPPSAIPTDASGSPLLRPSASSRRSMGTFPAAGSAGGASSGGSPPPPLGSVASLGGARQLDGAAGEYRGIMSLCRLLPGGFEAKLAVDSAIASCSAVGNLLADISRCKAQSEEPAEKGPAGRAAHEAPGGAAAAALLGPQFAARQLGLHYLKRYFLLITYRCYLDTLADQRCGFSEWFHQQPELHHLAHHLTLDT